MISTEILFTKYPEAEPIFTQMPCRLTKGDLIDIDSFVDERNVDEEAHLNSFNVDSVVFRKNELGVYQRVYVSGADKII